MLKECLKAPLAARVAVSDQGRHSQFLAGKATTVEWRPHQRRAAAAAVAFYSTKSRQGIGLGGLGGPADYLVKIEISHLRFLNAFRGPCFILGSNIS